MNELTNQQLAALFHSLDDEFYFYPNQGNAGDSLITCATLQFFEKHKIKYHLVLDMEFESTGKSVIHGGGGNCGGMQSRAARFLVRHKESAKNLILLPHTITDVAPLLSELKANAHLICREKVSYQYVSDTAPNASVYLHDDIVFQSNPRLLVEQRPNVSLPLMLVKEIFKRLTAGEGYDYGLSIKGYLRLLKFKLSQLFNPPKQYQTLYAFRSDHEKTDVEIPPGNIDLSAEVELGACVPDLAKLACYYFLGEIDKYQEVHTNRLHIAIGAACLGKKVKLHANNYFKIKAIYDYSIVNNYPNVEWVVTSDSKP